MSIFLHGLLPVLTEDRMTQDDVRARAAFPFGNACMQFNHTIPPLMGEEFKAANLDSGQIDPFACHPGGAQVALAIKAALHLQQGRLMQIAPLTYLTFLLLPRLGERAIARRNTVPLPTRGAYAAGAGYYPVLVAMHTVWTFSLLFLAWQSGILALPRHRCGATGAAGLDSQPFGRAMDKADQHSPAPPVMRRPVKYPRYLNYSLVVTKNIVVPMVVRLVWIARVVTTLNAAQFWVRIGAENAALAPCLPHRSIAFPLSTQLPSARPHRSGNRSATETGHHQTRQTARREVKHHRSQTKEYINVRHHHQLALGNGQSGRGPSDVP